MTFIEQFLITISNCVCDNEERLYNKYENRNEATIRIHSNVRGALFLDIMHYMLCGSCAAAMRTTVYGLVYRVQS